MSETDANRGTGARQGDALLWLAAAAVAAIGGAWLILLEPWAGDDVRASAEAVSAPAPARAEPAVAEPTDESPGTELESAAADPLRTAELALEAGMLVAPESHSAWALYSSVLETDPDNEAALGGRARVAELLIARAETALEQGRFDDARAAGRRILDAIEGHEAANRLMARIEAATRPPPPEPEPEPEPEPAPDPAETALAAASTGFEEAMGAGRLLTPESASARRFVATMRSIDPADERTLAARDRLFGALLERSSRALESLDTTAARTWIEEAEKLDVDAAAVAAAREALVDVLVERESQRRVPLSSLELVEYVAPAYPRFAQLQQIEGWVEVEFDVTTDGTTREIAVVDASHEDLFRDETVEAVEQWRIEPRRFMDRTIAQRAYTRIRFNLD